MTFHQMRGYSYPVSHKRKGENKGPFRNGHHHRCLSSTQNTGNDVKKIFNIMRLRKKIKKKKKENPTRAMGCYITERMRKNRKFKFIA